jgi:hypothetical protein
MKLTTLTTATAALAVTLACAQSAQAREHHYRHGGYYRHAVSHAAGHYAFAHHYAPAAEQNDNWGWGERMTSREGATGARQLKRSRGRLTPRAAAGPARRPTTATA